MKNKGMIAFWGAVLAGALILLLVVSLTKDEINVPKPIDKDNELQSGELINPVDSIWSQVDNKDSGESIKSGEYITDISGDNPFTQVIEYEIAIKDTVVTGEQEEVINLLDEKGKNEKFDAVLMDDKRIAFVMQNKDGFSYFYENEELTGMEYYWRYDTEEEATEMAEGMNKYPGQSRQYVISAAAKGNYVVVTYSKEKCEDKTYESVKNMYDYYTKQK